MNYILIFGFSGTLPDSISVWFQTYLSIKKRSYRDLSIKRCIIEIFGMISWIIYGILTLDYPILISGIFVFLGNIVLIIYYLNDNYNSE